MLLYPQLEPSIKQNVPECIGHVMGFLPGQVGSFGLGFILHINQIIFKRYGDGLGAAGDA